MSWDRKRRERGRERIGTCPAREREREVVERREREFPTRGTILNHQFYFQNFSMPQYMYTSLIYRPYATEF